MHAETSTGLHPSVEALLAAHGIAGDEAAFAHDGYSGARLTRIDDGHDQYIIKRIRYGDDWVMQISGDEHCREAQIAASPLVGRLPAGVRVPTLGAARDGDGWALLMRDISPRLLPRDAPISADTLGFVLRRLAELHAAFWADPVDDSSCDFCPTDVRLNLIRPATGRLLLERGIDFGLVRGWERFGALAPPAVAAMVHRLHDDPSPLARIIDALPATLLHGDAKLANTGIDGDALLLFDWAIAAHGAVCLELSWFLTVNSSRLPPLLEDVIERYRELLETALGPTRFAAADWRAQRAALMLIGVMQYGWGKALDADAGRPQELAWWCDGAAQAMRFFGW